MNKAEIRYTLNTVLTDDKGLLLALAREFPDAPISVRRSQLAGNCYEGSAAFARLYFNGRTQGTLWELLPHYTKVFNHYIARVVRYVVISALVQQRCRAVRFLELCPYEPILSYPRGCHIVNLLQEEFTPCPRNNS